MTSPELWEDVVQAGADYYRIRMAMFAPVCLDDQVGTALSSDGRQNAGLTTVGDPSTDQVRLSMREELESAEAQYFLLRRQLIEATNLDDQLRRALNDPNGRSLALELLLNLPLHHLERHIAAIFDDATYTHGNIQFSRPALARLPFGVATRLLWPLVERRLEAEDEPWEAYLRSAEVLNELGQEGLLEKVISRAKVSPDPDVLDTVQFMRSARRPA